MPALYVIMPRKQTPMIVHLRVHTKDLGAGIVQHTEDETPVYDPNVTFTDPKPVSSLMSIQYEPFTPSDNRPLKTGANTEVIECNVEYKDAKIYPRNSRTVCWWDGHPFDTKPFFIPKNIYAHTHSHEDTEYNVYGNFCSPECALAHLHSETALDPELKWGRVMLLQEMAKKVYNDETKRLSPSLPRWVLKEYGGGLSIEEYREACTKTRDSCEIVYPPIIVDMPILKMSNVEKKPQKVEKVIINEDRFRKAEQNLSKNKEVIPEKKGILELMNIRITEA